jgi:CTP synthase
MLESAGLHFVGCDESRNRMEVLSKQHMLFLGFDFFFRKSEPACTYEQIVELQDHPFYVGVQFHPEFKSRPRRPSPPFTGESLFYC